MFGIFSSSCFFYYFLDIIVIGYVIYLPFAIMLWLFRLSIETYYVDCSKDEYPPIYNIEEEIWN